MAAGLGDAGDAASGDGLTIGDVAAMERYDRIEYVQNEASQRVLQIGKAHGDRVLRCLSPEFAGFKQISDKTYELPRGLKAAIRYVHIANNNGNAAEPAPEGIGGIVDIVARRVCGVPAAAAKSSP